jgi:putative solute:sodium symporter small subunit
LTTVFWDFDFRDSGKKMRTFEAVLGLLIMAAAVLWAAGAASAIAPIAPAGLGVTLALAGVGATITAHGLAGRAVRRSALAAASRWRAIFYAVLVLTLTATLPLAVDLLDLTSVAGFPLGYYVAAQGLLILFGIIAFRAASRMDAIDLEETKMDMSGNA